MPQSTLNVAFKICKASQPELDGTRQAIPTESTPTGTVEKSFGAKSDRAAVILALPTACWQCRLALGHRVTRLDL
jgi:hypothetical protein